MKYSGGEEVRVGDIVEMGGSYGVFFMFLGPDDYPNNMNNIPCSVMFEFEKFGKIIYSQSQLIEEVDLRLVSRAQE